MKVWLDDVRPAPEGWAWVTTAEQLLAVIFTLGLDALTEISFDNDLGLGLLEGHDVLARIEELVLTNQVERVPELWVHSRNPVARERMQIIIERIMTHAAQRAFL